MTFRKTIRDTNYDSVLEPARRGVPAKLRLRLLVNLIPRDPSIPGSPSGSNHPAHLVDEMKDVRRGRLNDADGDPFACRSWLRREFNAFKIKFKQMVELSWNNQLILLPPAEEEDGSGLSDEEYLQFVDDPRRPARVEGELEIQFAPPGHASQATIEVVRLDPPQNGAFRSRMTRITNEDVVFETHRKERWSNMRFNQVTAAHEVGHWLRMRDEDGNLERFLPHVDAEACSLLPEDERPDNCGYGLVADTRLALMGSGNLVTDYEARIWLVRARRHTGALFGWRWIHRVHFDKGLAPISERQRRLTQGTRAGAARAAAHP